jgi:hypothetical protein
LCGCASRAAVHSRRRRSFRRCLQLALDGRDVGQGALPALLGFLDTARIRRGQALGATPDRVVSGGLFPSEFTLQDANAVVVALRLLGAHDGRDTYQLARNGVAQQRRARRDERGCAMELTHALPLLI